MKSILLSLIVCGFSGAWADSQAPLDPPYGNFEPVVNEIQIQSFSNKNFQFESFRFTPKANALEVARAQSPVKSQGRRGTCSIFSATAVLEFKLKEQGFVNQDVDLSEQWLEYITAGQRGQEGSWSDYNMNRIGRYGFVSEDKWEYNPTSWHPYDEDYWSFRASSFEKELFESFCEPLSGNAFEGCLIGQMDPKFLQMNQNRLEEISPDFLDIRETAIDNLRDLEVHIQSRSLRSVQDIQQTLDGGDVVALDIDFFYEAWNHRKATEYGLKRDLDLWSQGIVSFPDRNSKDYIESKKTDQRAGHAIVLVGYDKDKVIERVVEDRNGKPMTVSTKGVYYFKNSWGKNSFGNKMTLNGEKLPGFGMISMDYAHRDGRFFKMILQ